jgi:hypothetical protein
MYSARDGSSYQATRSYGRKKRGTGESGTRILRNASSVEGRAKCYSFPLEIFEAAVLGCLREINPSEVLGDMGSGASELALLQGEWGRVEDELALAKALMDKHGLSEAIGERVVKLESRRTELAAALVVARDKAAHPLSESWGETQSLIDVLERATDKDDARLRLRAALRRIVESIHLLVVPVSRSTFRMCAVEVRFVGGGMRQYLIVQRPPKNNQHSNNGPGGWFTFSATEKECEVGLFRGNDLRDKDGVAEVLALLEAIPAKVLNAILADPYRVGIGVSDDLPLLFLADEVP